MTCILVDSGHRSGTQPPCGDSFRCPWSGCFAICTKPSSSTKVHPQSCCPMVVSRRWPEGCAHWRPLHGTTDETSWRLRPSRKHGANQTSDCPPSRMADNRPTSAASIARLRLFDKHRVRGHDLGLQGIPRITLDDSFVLGMCRRSQKRRFRAGRANSAVSSLAETRGAPALGRSASVSLHRDLPSRRRVNTLGKYKFTDDLRCILLIGKNRRPVMDDYDFRGSIVYRFLDRSRGRCVAQSQCFRIGVGRNRRVCARDGCRGDTGMIRRAAADRRACGNSNDNVERGGASLSAFSR